MAISYVNEAQYIFAGVANTAVRAGIPTGIQVGDLLVCAFGNVSSQSFGSTMNNGWTKIEEEGTDGTNCYFLMAAKIATSTEVSAAGSSVQIATLDTSTGNTNKTAQTMAYRGTKSTVGTAIIASNAVHESSPGDQTINTGSASSTSTSQWYVCFFNMADTGDATGSSWSSTAATFRGDAEENNGSSTTSSVAGYDSGGTIAVSSWSRNGTWSGSASRLNAGIMIIDAAAAPVATALAGVAEATVVANGIAGAAEAIPPESGYQFLIDWDNDGDFADDGEDVTERALNTGGSIDISYGRDQARFLSAIQPGETSFDLNNSSRDYSPSNQSSPLLGNLAPGKPVLIRAVHNSTIYNLFRGFLDGYELVPGGSATLGVVKLSALDLMNKLSRVVLSTPLYQSLQTGEAINALLDEIGWPEDDRDIDQGASTLRWWWEEGSDALTALNRIVDSEGPAAFAFVGADGNFVFRDRHHRFIETASTEVQATFRADGDSPTFSAPYTYDIGWKDLINQVIIEVEQREPLPVSEVWVTEAPVSLAAGESRVIEVRTDQPFFNAIIPTTSGFTKDIQFQSGSTVGVQLSRDSGQSATITLTATSAVVIKRIALRAQSVEVARKVKVVAENPESIRKHGVVANQDIKPDWASMHDAFAIASIIVAQRGEQLPVVHITVKNGDDTRYENILGRDLSDRIHIVETDETGVDHDFFIEQIKHTVSEGGKAHFVEFGCEQAFIDTTSAPTYFTFDKSGAGFDDGVFGEEGQLQSDKLFILDHPGDNGKLDVAGLGF